MNSWNCSVRECWKGSSGWLIREKNLITSLNQQMAAATSVGVCSHGDPMVAPGRLTIQLPESTVERVTCAISSLHAYLATGPKDKLAPGPPAVSSTTNVLRDLKLAESKGAFSGCCLAVRWDCFSVPWEQRSVQGQAMPLVDKTMISDLCG